MSLFSLSSCAEIRVPITPRNVGSRAAELEARRLKRQRLAENDDDSDTAVSQLLAERQAQKKTRGGKTAAPKVKKAYVPERKSGSYALLVGLLLALPDYLQQPLPPLNTADPEAEDVREDHIMQHLLKCQLTKSDLMSAASDHCRISMFTSENGGFHTGWNSMKTLVSKDLVTRRGNPPRFHLTREGYKCAVSVWHAANEETGGLPPVQVPIQAMGGFQFALPPVNAQAGPDPSTVATHAASRAVNPARSTMSGGASAPRSKRPDNAYVPVIDDMDFLDDFPSPDDYQLGREPPVSAASRHRGSDLIEEDVMSFADAMPSATLESRTVEGLQFWYIGKSFGRFFPASVS